MLDNWKKFNASADEGVPGNCSRYVMTLKPHPIYIGNDGQLNEEKITETIATLNEINTRLSRLLFFRSGGSLELTMSRQVTSRQVTSDF